jgi:type IV pilus assembly protein PilY1
VGIDEFGNFLNGSNPHDRAITATTLRGIRLSAGPHRPARRRQRGVALAEYELSGPISDFDHHSRSARAQCSSPAPRACCGTILRRRVEPGRLDNHSRRRTSRSITGHTRRLFGILTGVQIANEAAMTRERATPIAYKLKITTDGLLSLSYSINSGAYQPVITGQNITTSNGPAANFLFGFAGSTGGDTNIHEIMCFRATPVNQSSSSAGTNQQQAAKIQAGSQVYFAYYNPDTWAGSLTAQYLMQDANGNITGYSTPTWDASCVLTGLAEGATCPTTGAASAPAEGRRAGPF